MTRWRAPHQGVQDRLMRSWPGLVLFLSLSTHALAQAPRCEPFKPALDGEFVVFAAGAHAGRKLDFQIDDSGSEASQIEVVVNYGDSPVVLMLGAYGPTIWNIRWTRDTYIAGIVAGGYHRQVIAGAPKDLPTLITTFDNKGPCGYFDPSADAADGGFDPVARRLFARPVERFHAAKDGQVVIGSAPTSATELLSARENPPESYFDPDAPLAGKAGLADAMKRGLIRKATRQDVEDWLAAVVAWVPSPDEPPLADGAAAPAQPRLGSQTYVVLAPFRYPAGLYGGDAATFFVPQGVPRPTGDSGHSEVYDFNDVGRGARLPRQHPAIYYRRASELFRSNRKDEAVFWMYVGELRWRFHLLANPGAPDRDPAAFGSHHQAMRDEIHAHALGNPQEWARQIERALDWDARHPDEFTSKSAHAAEYQRNREGLQELQAQISRMKK